MKTKDIAKEHGFDQEAFEQYLVKAGAKLEYGFMGVISLKDDVEGYVQRYKNYLDEKKAKEEALNSIPSAFRDSYTYSPGSGHDRPYVVCQITLKEKLEGTGSGNLTDLEDTINHFFEKGYRLHTMSTSNGGSKGPLGGDRIQATLVFEKIDLFKMIS